MPRGQPAAGVEAGRLFVRVLPDTKAFARSLLAYLQRFEQRTVVRLRVLADTKQFAAEVKTAIALARKDARLTVPVDVTTAALARQVQRAAAIVSRTTRIRLPVDLDTRLLAKAANELLSFGASAGKVTLLSGALALAAAQAVHLAAALAPAAGAIAALPAFIVGAVASIAALRIAFGGLAEAMEDPQALAKLAPAARELVVELKALAPAWLAVKQAVQGSVFAGVAAVVRELAALWLPLLRQHLTGIGQAWNAAFREVAALATGAGFLADINTALGDTVLAGQSLSRVLAPLAGVFVDLAAVASSFLPSLAGGLSQLVADFAEFISTARETGQLAGFFALVGQTVKDLGGIALQVGGILHAVFSAANVSGGGLLAGMREVLSTLNQFASSTAGQQALQGFFASIGAVVSALLPIVTELIAALGPGIAVLLGPDGLGGALRELAPAARPVGMALAALAKAAAPLLVLLGSVLADALSAAAGGLLALAAEAGPLIRVFADAGLAVTRALMPALLTLIQNGLPNAIRLGQGLAEAFAPLVPVVAEMANLFVTNAIPALEQLAQLSATQLIPALIEAAQHLGGALLDALQQLVPHIPSLATATVQAAIALAQLVIAVVPLIPLLAQILAVVIRLTTSDAGIRLLTLVVASLVVGLQATAGSVHVLVSAFMMAARWGQLAGAAIRDGFGSAIMFVRSIPGQLVAPFAGAGGWLVDAGRKIINGLIDGIQSQINRLKAKLRELTNLIPSWKGPAERDRRLLAPSGRLLMQGLLAGITSQMPALRHELAAITRTISSDVTAGIERIGPPPPGGQPPVVPRPPSIDSNTAVLPPSINLTALVRVGDGPIHEAVETVIADNPARFASHLRVGERSLTRRG